MSFRFGVAAVRALALMVVLGAVSSGPAAAQGMIQIGQMVTGTITASDPTFSDGSHYDRWTFFGQAGQAVQIDLISSDFDAELLLFDQNNRQLARDDDGGEGLNSRITFTLTYTGNYTVAANSHTAGGFGNYTLRLMPAGGMMAVAPTPVAVPTGVVGTIGLNQQVTSILSQSDARLPDGKIYQAYNFMCQPGVAFQLDVESSAFDTYAIVQDPMGSRVAYDDDTGEGTNSRLTYTCPMAGVYRLVSTVYSSSASGGQYTMRVTGMGAPVVQQVPQPVVQAIPQPVAQPIPQPVAQPGVTLPAPAMQPVGEVPAPGARATINVGEIRPGRLEQGDQLMNDGSFADVWTFAGMPGQQVTIEARSAEFDAFLQLLDPNGSQLAEDDNSGGGRDARIVFTLATSGAFQIVVNNFGAGQRAGVYTLSVR